MSISQLHPHRAAPVHEALARLTSEQEVVGLARDFAARIGPEDWAALPPQCRPAKFVDGDDVVEFAFTLASNHCDVGHISAAGVHARLTSFFADAARRISQIRAMYRLDEQESA